MKTNKPYHQTGTACVIITILIIFTTFIAYINQQFTLQLVYINCFLILLDAMLLTKYIAEYLNNKDYE